MSTRKASILAVLGVSVALLVPSAIAQTGDFPDGLARAFQSVGQSIFGANNFFATRFPPSPIAPATLGVFVSDYPPSPIVLNIYDTAGHTYLRITVSNGQATIENDPSIKTQSAIGTCAGCGFENPPLPPPDVIVR